GGGFLLGEARTQRGRGLQQRLQKGGQRPRLRPLRWVPGARPEAPRRKGGGPWQGEGNRRLPRSGSPKGSSQPAGLLPYSLKKAPRQAARGGSLGVYGLGRGLSQAVSAAVSAAWEAAGSSAAGSDEAGRLSAGSKQPSASTCSAIWAW